MSRRVARRLNAYPAASDRNLCMLPIPADVESFSPASYPLPLTHLLHHGYT